MDFSLNDEQALLKDSVEKFLQTRYDFDTRRVLLDSDTGFSRDFWTLFAELGWLALPFPEEDDGLGGGPVETMVLMEQFGHGIVIEPYLGTIVLAGSLLSRCGSDAQKAEWLPGIMEGTTLASLAWIEPQARFDVANVATRAKRDGDGWRIDGRKSVVLDAATSDLLIVPARTSGDQSDPHGISLFLVRADSAGISRRDYPTVDGFRASELVLEGVHIDDGALLGEVDAGLPPLVATLERGTLAVCAEAVGIMDVLLAKTIEYTKTRQQFGVPISSFQALQHRMVDMLMMLEQSRSLLLAATMRAQENDAGAPAAIAALKYYIGRHGRKLGEEAIQLHGGMGVTDELDVSHYFKRLIMIDTLFGNADHQLQRFIDASAPDAPDVALVTSAPLREAQRA